MTKMTRRVLLAALAGGISQAALAGAPVTSLRPRLRGAATVSEEANVEPDLVRPVQRPDDLQVPRVPEISELVKKAKLDGRVSICVRDAHTGEILEGYAQEEPIPPASVTKVITSLYAIEALGHDYRFETHLVATGPVKDGVIQGDLLLVGGGDPTLDTDALAEMAAALAERGITGATGRLRPWGGLFPRLDRLDPMQPEQVTYNPTLTGLALNFNRVHFEWRRTAKGYNLSMDGRSKSHVPPVRISRISAANRERPTYIYEDGGTFDSWTVARPRLGKGGTRWLPSRKPNRYAAEVMAYFLKKSGITITIGDPLESEPEGQVLVTHRSEPLDDILKGLLKYSNNLTAELCGLAASRAREVTLASLMSSADAMTEWARARLGMTNAVFHDHSGLNENTRMQADELSRAIYNTRSLALRPLLKHIPIKDTGGRRVQDHPMDVMAKTGTLFFASSLAGFAREGRGRDMIFAILSVNDKRRDGFDTRRELPPEGASAWNARAKRLQQDLILRWGEVYD